MKSLQQLGGVTIWAPAAEGPVPLGGVRKLFITVHTTAVELEMKGIKSCRSNK